MTVVLPGDPCSVGDNSVATIGGVVEGDEVKNGSKRYTPKPGMTSSFFAYYSIEY